MEGEAVHIEVVTAPAAENDLIASEIASDVVEQLAPHNEVLSAVASMRLAFTSMEARVSQILDAVESLKDSNARTEVAAIESAVNSVIAVEAVIESLEEDEDEEDETAESEIELDISPTPPVVVEEPKSSKHRWF